MLPIFQKQAITPVGFVGCSENFSLLRLFNQCFRTLTRSHIVHSISILVIPLTCYYNGIYIRLMQIFIPTVRSEPTYRNIRRKIVRKNEDFFHVLLCCCLIAMDIFLRSEVNYFFLLLSCYDTSLK